MKTVRVAYLLFIIIFALVFTNSIILQNIIEGYEEQVNSIDTSDNESAEREFCELYENFKKDERYINLTVTHEDLTNIEEMFSAAIGAARGEDSAELEITKSRLSDALGHLGRLVGINLDSIL